MKYIRETRGSYVVDEGRKRMEQKSCIEGNFGGRKFVSPTVWSSKFPKISKSYSDSPTGLSEIASVHAFCSILLHSYVSFIFNHFRFDLCKRRQHCDNRNNMNLDF